jgi:ERCC4-related helicase
MRNRLWRVDNVFETEFSATPIDGRDTYPRRFLSEIEEPTEGSLPLPKPAITSDPSEQDLLLRAFRLSLVHGSAPLAGMQRSRAIPTPYQLVPLLLAVGRERVRLLIADDVGVGKTIEMGLVVSEMVARGLVRRALFVVPANLREQTRDALSHFFHIDATIVAGHLLRGLERQLMPGQSVWHAHSFVVVSIDYAKLHPGEILGAGWDLVVFDEAHLCARPHVAGGAHGWPDLERRKFAVTAAGQIAHLILMTATPHNGHSDSFASIIELLDVGAVAWRGRSNDVPVIDRGIAAPHVVQRRRADIEAWYRETGQPFPFPKRDQKEEIVRLGPEEQLVLEELRAYTQELASRSPAVINQWVALHLQKRALSSPAALRQSLRNRLAALRKKLGDEAGSVADAEIAVMDTEGGDDLSDEQRSARVDRSALAGLAEMHALEGVLELAEKVTARRDSKYQELVTRVVPLAFQRQQAKRAIIFTKYKDTLDYLVANLREDAKRAGRATGRSPRVGGAAVFAIYGEMNGADRRAEFARFEAAEPAILVATDCISEGMNLQRACAALVHYELPWNPNRLEQRNGRIDRYRQREPRVTIRTLVYDDPLDVTILRVLIDKANEIRSKYGFAPPFFSSNRELVELMKLYGHTAPRQLDLFSAAAEFEPGAEVPEVVALSEEAAQRMSEESFYGHATVSLEEVQRALTDTYRTVGTPDEVHAFVRAALARFGCPVRELDPDRFEVDLDRAPVLADLAPEGGVLRATFDAMVGQDDLSVDTLDLAHPLVRRLIDLVRDGGVGALDSTQVGRVVGWAHTATRGVLAVIHVLARYTSGGEQPVLLEELVAFAFPVWDDEPSRVTSELLKAVIGPGRVASSMTGNDLVEAAQRALDHPALGRLTADALEDTRWHLAQRGASLEEAGGAWAAGLGTLELASQDLLTISIVEPPA